MENSSAFFAHSDWKGCYRKDIIDRNGIPLSLDEDLLFNVVTVEDQLNSRGEITNWVLVVPEHWVDTTSRFVLYPHPDYTLFGILPKDWSKTIFNRRRFPTNKFVEYAIGDFMVDSVGKLHRNIASK